MSSTTALLDIDPDVGPGEPELVERFRALVQDDQPLPKHIETGGASGDAVLRALAATAPLALDRHRREGIPTAVTVNTLRDVGRKHCLYGADTVLPWLLGILRGDVVEVGRLQVERRRGDLGHALHIPETGALVPESVSASLAAAALLTGSNDFSCTSWLLDSRLPIALPDSRIASFAKRFTVVGNAQPTVAASAEVAKFAFQRSLADVLDPRVVVPRTSLERLIATSLRAGEHWTQPVGVLSVAAHVIGAEPS